MWGPCAENKRSAAKAPVGSAALGPVRSLAGVRGRLAPGAMNKVGPAALNAGWVPGVQDRIPDQASLLLLEDVHL